MSGVIRVITHTISIRGICSTFFVELLFRFIRRIVRTFFVRGICRTFCVELPFRFSSIIHRIAHTISIRGICLTFCVELPFRFCLVILVIARTIFIYGICRTFFVELPFRFLIRVIARTFWICCICLAFFVELPFRFLGHSNCLDLFFSGNPRFIYVVRITGFLVQVSLLRPVRLEGSVPDIVIQPSPTQFFMFIKNDPTTIIIIGTFIQTHFQVSFRIRTFMIME